MSFVLFLVLSDFGSFGNGVMLALDRFRLIVESVGNYVGDTLKSSKMSGCDRSMSASMAIDCTSRLFAVPHRHEFLQVAADVHVRRKPIAIGITWRSIRQFSLPSTSKFIYWIDSDCYSASCVSVRVTSIWCRYRSNVWALGRRTTNGDRNAGNAPRPKTRHAHAAI